MWWYKKVLNNCKHATFLLEKKHLGSISLLQEATLRIHLKGCYICRRYNEQSKLINDMVGQLYHARTGESLTLDQNFKSMLRDRIDAEIKKTER